MSYGEYLKELVAPLGVYRLEGTLNAAELDCHGEALDQVFALLENIHREADLTTAQENGLLTVERLFSRRPVTNDRERLRAALIALLRVSGDSFTLAAINDNLAGCGVNAVAMEGDTPQTLTVRFPDVAGIPEGYEQMKKIIEDILPCHLDIAYHFWYMNWQTMEERFPSWAAVEECGLPWSRLEALKE